MLRSSVFFLMLLMQATVLAQTSATESTAPAEAGTTETAPDPETATTAPDGESNADEGSEEIRYVDDTLVIVMRAGDSNKFKIIRNLPSGTVLEVLGTSGDYSRVRTRSGTEGWVLSQYLSKEPIARDKLKSANQQIAKLKAQNKQLSKDLFTVTNERAALSKENDKLTAQLQNFRSVAAKPIQMQEENQQLAKEKVSLENDKAMMQQELQVLRDQSDKRWFLAGAGVLLCGMFLGLMIPKMRRRRKSDWSSL